MAKPIVAIVGRPNVGKSTLFNKIVGQRLSIVEDTPGVTRDRIFGDGEWCGRTFSLVDTGGIEPASKDVILTQMREQAQIAIDSAAAIILVTDIRSGVTATDQDVASLLLKSGVPVVLCVNKCDTVGEPPAEFYEFYNLGLGDPVMVSSVHGHGTGDLLDRVVALLAVERADVCLILIDAPVGFTEQDSKVAGIAHEAGKGCIICVNKWDAIEKDDKTMQEMQAKLEKDFSFMSYAPILFISAKTGQRLDKMFELIKQAAASNAMRVTTGVLNDILAQSTARVQPPTDKGKRLKIYYMTQASTKPPTFVCFCNDHELFHYSYQRYLINRIRETFGLTGTPVRLVIRERGEQDGKR